MLKRTFRGLLLATALLGALSGAAQGQTLSGASGVGNTTFGTPSTNFTNTINVQNAPAGALGTNVFDVTGQGAAAISISGSSIPAFLQVAWSDSPTGPFTGGYYYYTGYTSSGAQGQGSGNTAVYPAMGRYAYIYDSAASPNFTYNMAFLAVVPPPGVQSVSASENGTWSVGGYANAGSTLSNNPLYSGCANTATAVSTAGNQAVGISCSANGVLDSPRAGTADRVVTKTSLAATTSTTICPTAVKPVAEEIFFSVAGVGISFSGGTLTTATPGTTAGTTPDWATTAANQVYTFPVPATNAITAYGAAGLVTCVQTLRQ